MSNNTSGCPLEMCPSEASYSVNNCTPVRWLMFQQDAGAETSCETALLSQPPPLLPPSLLLLLLPLPLFLSLPPHSIVFLPFIFLFFLTSSSSSRSYWAMCLLCQAGVIQEDSEVTLLDLLFWPKPNCHCLFSPASLYLIHSEHTTDTASHGYSGCSQPLRVHRKPCVRQPQKPILWIIQSQQREVVL